MSVHRKHDCNKARGIQQVIVTEYDEYEHKHHRPLPQYDALVAYAANNIPDIDFVCSITDALPKLNVCLVDHVIKKKHLPLDRNNRNQRSNSSFHIRQTVRQLMQRCRRLIILLSKNFVEGPLMAGFAGYVSELSIAERQRKVIICLDSSIRALQPHRMPAVFHMLAVRDYAASPDTYWSELCKEVTTVKKDITATSAITGAVSSTIAALQPSTSAPKSVQNTSTTTHSKPAQPQSDADHQRKNETTTRPSKTGHAKNNANISERDRTIANHQHGDNHPRSDRTITIHPADREWLPFPPWNSSRKDNVHEMPVIDSGSPSETRNAAAILRCRRAAAQMSSYLSSLEIDEDEDVLESSSSQIYKSTINENHAIATPMGSTDFEPILQNASTPRTFRKEVFSSSQLAGEEAVICTDATAMDVSRSRRLKMGEMPIENVQSDPCLPLLVESTRLWNSASSKRDSGTRSKKQLQYTLNTNDDFEPQNYVTANNDSSTHDEVEDRKLVVGQRCRSASTSVVPRIGPSSLLLVELSPRCSSILGAVQHNVVGGIAVEGEDVIAVPRGSGLRAKGFRRLVQFVREKLGTTPR